MSRQPLCLKKALSSIHEHWSPRIVASLNGQEVKLAKFEGAFDWHAHENEDELFLVVHGEFTMEFRDRSVALCEGEMIVVPRGVEHRPVAEQECHVLLFEPAGLINTGDAEVSDRTTSGTWITGCKPSKKS
jgi:mannose-6-phosphate isomerase-like protein (cupin superfamily)